MRTLIICLALVTLALVIAAGLYVAAGVFLLNYLQQLGGGSPENYLGIAFMAVFPVCLFAGSFVAGYLGQPHIRNPYLFLLFSPGLYVGMFALAMSARTTAGFLPFMMLCSLAWIISSIAGVYFGKYLRGRTTKMEGGDVGVA